MQWGGAKIINSKTEWNPLKIQRMIFAVDAYYHKVENVCQNQMALKDKTLNGSLPFQNR